MRVLIATNTAITATLKAADDKDPEVIKQQAKAEVEKLSIAVDPRLAKRLGMGSSSASSSAGWAA